MFFPEEITLRLMQARDYAAGSVERKRPDGDGIYRHQGGAASTARLAPISAADPGRGYGAALVAAIDASAWGRIDTTSHTPIGATAPSRAWTLRHHSLH